MPGIRAKAVKNDEHYWWCAVIGYRSHIARLIRRDHPGYFTTLAGFEAQPAGLLKFAGEHTSSFYEAQGLHGGCVRIRSQGGEGALDDINHSRLWCATK